MSNITNRYFSSVREYTPPVVGRIKAKAGRKPDLSQGYARLKPVLRGEYEYQKHHYKHKMGLIWDWTFNQYCEAWFNRGPMIYNYKGRKKYEYTIFPISFDKPFGVNNYRIDTGAVRREFFDKRRKKKYTPQAGAKFKGIISPNGVFCQLQEFEDFYAITRYQAYKLLDGRTEDFGYSKRLIRKTETHNDVSVDIEDYVVISVNNDRGVKIKPCVHCGKTNRKTIAGCKKWVACRYA